MATTTLEGCSLSYATIDTADIAADVHLEGCTIATITGCINGTTTMTNMTERPKWHNVACIDPIGIDDKSLPSDLTGECELFASDAPRLAKYASEVWGKTLVYTEYFDDDIDFVKEVDGELERGTGSLRMAEEVSELRMAVISGRVTFARLAWREGHKMGYIEIEVNRTGLDPQEGDPHVFWVRHEEQVECDYTRLAKALLAHIEG